MGREGLRRKVERMTDGRDEVDLIGVHTKGKDLT